MISQMKHRTGCIIACYRMLNHWSPTSVITEYRQFAGTKARPLDEIFIRSFDVPGMLALLKMSSKKGVAGTAGLVAGGGGNDNSSAAAAAAAMMLPTPPASDRDFDPDVVEDDRWTLHVGI